MNATYVVVQFIGSNTYTRADAHGNFILFSPEELHSHGISHILRTQTDIDNAQEDEWYAMETDLLESAYGTSLPT